MLNVLSGRIILNNSSDYNFKTREYYGPVKITNKINRLFFVEK